MRYDPLFRRPLRFEETAAPNKEWWDKLSRNEQLQYLKEHPKTPFKKLGVKNPGGGAPSAPPTTIEEQNKSKLGNEPGDKAVKALNTHVDEKLARLQKMPEVQRALEAGSPNRVNAANSIRQNTRDITARFKQEVPPAGVSKTADQLRTLMDLPPETPEQQLRNSLFTGGAAILARTAFMHYGMPAMGLTPTLGLTVGTGIASVVLFGMMREMLKRRTQKTNIEKVLHESKPHRQLAELLAEMASELDDAPHLDKMDDDKVFHLFLGKLADSMEHADMPLSYWARGFDMTDQPQGDSDVHR